MCVPNKQWPRYDLQLGPEQFIKMMMALPSSLIRKSARPCAAATIPAHGITSLAPALGLCSSNKKVPSR